ncbi:MAG: aminoacyl-tRNA hydrolase [Desulfobacula sp.]|nr:aminoacyl-tRNA hydrolase [Desulfobacula sp.]
MSDSKFKIIAGLGNPGKNYAQTRHNIGFLTIEALASQSSLSIDQSRFDSEYAKARIKGVSCFLVKPLTYMNKSGFPIHRFASYYKVAMEDIIIVHDDMDLDFGKIKIVKSRGHGGHNGVRSIINAFGKKDCIRIRIGVGHPKLQNNGHQKDITGHVLGSFSKDEKKKLDSVIDNACNACFHLLENSVTSAMNLFNQG